VTEPLTAEDEQFDGVQGSGEPIYGMRTGLEIQTYTGTREQTQRLSSISVIKVLTYDAVDGVESAIADLRNAQLEQDGQVP
jgi:hypothetical protein